MLEFLRSEVMHWKTWSWRPIPFENVPKSSPYNTEWGNWNGIPFDNCYGIQVPCVISSLGGGGRRHKFLTSLVGLQVFWWPLLLLSFNYHSKDLAHPENSSQEPGNQQMVWRARGLNVHSQLYNKHKEITERSIYSVFCWHSPTHPTNHIPSLLLTPKCNRGPILQNYNSHPSHMKTIMLSVLTKKKIHISNT